MDENEIKQQCLHGDHEAFGFLVRKVQHRALFLALMLLRSQAEAEDAVQVSLVRAFERLEQFDSSRPFYPWFRAILKNECLKRLQRSKREVVQDATPEPEAEPRAPLVAEVREALGRMEAKDREILILKHVEGRGYDEISQSLQIPRGTVMSRLHAARARLRRVLLEDP